jgi:hypothetical protein
MIQHNQRRGGSRPGSGRHRKRIYLNTEAATALAELLRQQRNRLERPELSADEVVRNLITSANEQRGVIYEEIARSIQDIFQEKWQEMTQEFIKEIHVHFDSLYIEMMQKVKEEMIKHWLEDSKTEV